MHPPRTGHDDSAREPLSDADLARLDELLEAISPEGAMLLEEIDGFTAALACGPSPLSGDELLDNVLGMEDGEKPQFEGPAQRDELLALLSRHLASVADALAAGEGFSPILMHDDDGRMGGNLWAIGFLRGISVSPDGWEAIEEDDNLAALLEPFEALAEELDLETGEVQAPVPEDERQNLIDAMAEAAFQFHEYFEPQRTAGTRRH